MAGILNSKSRVIDAILTVEGRAKMAQGNYSVAYATFTDEGVAYIPDPINGHDDPTCKIYLEARNLPQDTITFTANDDGALRPLRGNEMRLTNKSAVVPGNFSQANLVNGKIQILSLIPGYSIKFGGIHEDPLDSGKGFTYSDHLGTTGSILIKNTIQGGTYEITGSPNPIGRIGTRGGMGSTQFASTVATVISLLSSSSGPKVRPNPQFGTLYIEPADGSLTGSHLTPIGILSSPITLVQPSIGGTLMSGEIDSPSFASQIEGILTSSFDNFGKCTTISSVDRIFGDENFTLSHTDVTFSIDRISPELLRSLTTTVPSVNGLESLFQDRKLSHLPNFSYLPPIIKASESNVGDKSKLENLTPYLLGEYPSWGRNETPLALYEIQGENSRYGNGESIPITQSSRNNRIISQFFEINSDGSVGKLDVVDSGTKGGKRVFFIGKTYLDNRGCPTFVNIFTLLLEPIAGERDIFT